AGGAPPRDGLQRGPPRLQSAKTKKSGLSPLFQEFSTCSDRRQGGAQTPGAPPETPRALDGPCLLVTRLLVGALDAGIVDEAGDWLAVPDVGLEDLLQVRLLNAAVPDVLVVEDHHRAVAALREAAGLVDPDVGLEAGLHGFVAEEFHVLLHVALRRTRIAGGAHEDVSLVLSHHWASTAAVFAALRSAMNLSTSSRIAWTISFSGTLRITSPFLKMSPMPRPPATPMSATRASPGPLTSHPITAMWISSFNPLNSSSTSFASLTRST